MIEDFLFDGGHLLDDGAVAFEVEVGQAFTPLIFIPFQFNGFVLFRMLSDYLVESLKVFETENSFRIDAYLSDVTYVTLELRINRLTVKFRFRLQVLL